MKRIIDKATRFCMRHLSVVVFICLACTALSYYTCEVAMPKYLNIDVFVCHIAFAATTACCLSAIIMYVCDHYKTYRATKFAEEYSRQRRLCTEQNNGTDEE